MREAERAAAGSVLIKRYANRRFYNTVTLTYASLADLAEMVLAGERFTVRDAESGDDITADILDRLH